MVQKGEEEVYEIIGKDDQQFFIVDEIIKNPNMNDVLVCKMLELKEIPFYERISLIKKKLGMRKVLKSRRVKSSFFG